MEQVEISVGCGFFSPFEQPFWFHGIFSTSRIDGGFPIFSLRGPLLRFRFVLDCWSPKF